MALSWLKKDTVKLVVHIILATAVLIMGIVEFSVQPPLFDVAGDRIGIKDHVFKNDQKAPKDNVRRLMDIPVLLNFLIYFGCFVSFLLINYWADNYFSWNYMSSRARGILLMVAAITASLVANAVVISWKKQKLFFEFKASRKDVHRLTRLTVLGASHDYGPASLGESTDSGQHVIIRKNAWVSVLWNVIALSIISCLCLIIWFSRMYMSYGCFSSLDEVLLLCQITTEVECYPCSECTSDGIAECGNGTMFYCLSQMPTMDQNQGAVCLFNYNIGLFTFLIVFSAIGGIYFVFMRLTRVFTNLFIQYVYRFYVRILRFYHSWRLRRHSSNSTSTDSYEDTEQLTAVQSPDS